MCTRSCDRRATALQPGDEKGVHVYTIVPIALLKHGVLDVKRERRLFISEMLPLEICGIGPSLSRKV